MNPLLLEALQIIKRCIYCCTMGKVGHNFSDLTRLEEIIEELSHTLT